MMPPIDDLILHAAARVPDESGAFEMASTVCAMRGLDPFADHWTGIHSLKNWQWVLVEASLLIRIAGVSF